MEHTHERAAGTELKCHVYVLFVLEAVYEADDIGMVQRLVDFDLCVKLEFSISIEDQSEFSECAPWF